MKKLLYTSFLTIILTSAVTYTEQQTHKEKFLCHNKFTDQVYVSVYTDQKPVHALIPAGGNKSIAYEGNIDTITVNFQFPQYPITIIEESDIPETLKMMTIYPSRKILLS